MSLSRTTNARVRVVGSLEFYLSGTSLLVLPTSPPRFLNRQHEAANFAGLNSSYNPIHDQNAVTILVCISSFVKYVPLITH